MPSTLPIDPRLPSWFFERSLLERSSEELDEWFDRPFAVRMASGALKVCCLDAGCHDRPTTLGIVATPEEAAQLAHDKLEAWQKLRSRPMLQIDSDGRQSLIRPAGRPDQDSEVILADCTREEAAAWLAEHTQD